MQLDFLLGQTQKYSTMLAERLKGEGAGAAAGDLDGGAVSQQPGASAPSASQQQPGPAGLSRATSSEARGSLAARRPRRPVRDASPAMPASAAVSGTADAGASSGHGWLAGWVLASL